MLHSLREAGAHEEDLPRHRLREAGDARRGHDDRAGRGHRRLRRRELTSARYQRARPGRRRVHEGGAMDRPGGCGPPLRDRRLGGGLGVGSLRGPCGRSGGEPDQQHRPVHGAGQAHTHTQD